MNNIFSNNSYTFGIKGSNSRAIQISGFKVLKGESGNPLVATHRNGEKTRIIIANVTIINTDEEGRFVGDNYGNISFELPKDLQTFGEEEALKIVSEFLKVKSSKDRQDMVYLGILHKGENRYSMDMPSSRTVEEIARRKCEEMRVAELKERQNSERANERIKDVMKERTLEQAKVQAEQGEQIKLERTKNPTMYFREYFDKNDNKTYLYGEITDVNTGDYLRLRKIEQLGENSYSGYIDRTSNIDDVECFDPEKGDFRKIRFRTNGMSLLEIAGKQNQTDIRSVSEYLSNLLDAEIKKEKEEQQGEER